MYNYYLVFNRKNYESNNTVLPKFTKEELDNAEKSKNWFIWNVNWFDYYLSKMLNY